jgi:hypothetical protein
MTTKPNRTAEYLLPLCLTVFFLYAAGSVLGLAMSDDSEYMQNVLFLNVSTFGRYREWAPLYTVWFDVLSIVCRNPVSRYFLSWGLLVASLALIPTWMKARSAWLYTFLVLATPMFTIWPFVSLFAAVIVLLSLCVLLRRKRTVACGTSTACFVCFIVAFVRPEFNYGVYSAAAATFLVLLFERLRPAVVERPQGKGRHGLLLAGCACLAAVTLWLQVRFPNPVPRSGMAFAQHFTLRAAKRGLIAANSANWTSDYAEKVFRIDAGHASTNGTATIVDFFHANPRLFMGHLGRNLLDPTFICCFALLLGVCFLPWMREKNRQLRSESAFLLLISFPVICSMILIFPRIHYVNVLFPAVLLLALQMFDLPPWRPSFAPIVLGVGVCLIWMLNVGVVLRRNGPESDDQMTLRRVQCERSVDLIVPPENQGVFSGDSVFQIYFARHRAIESPNAFADWNGFKSWALQAHPAWISATPEMAKQYGVTPHVVRKFVEDDLGYSAHPCPVEVNMTVFTSDLP